MKVIERDKSSNEVSCYWIKSVDRWKLPWFAINFVDAFPFYQFEYRTKDDSLLSWIAVSQRKTFSPLAVGEINCCGNISMYRLLTVAMCTIIVDEIIFKDEPRRVIINRVWLRLIIFQFNCCIFLKWIACFLFIYLNLKTY